MLGFSVDPALLGTHHRGMVLVRFRDSASRALDDPKAGLAALIGHDRAGRIGRVSALHPHARNEAAPGGAVVGALRGAAKVRGPARHHARSLLVQLHPSAHDAVDPLLQQLRGDPHVHSASLVPIRYIAAAKAPAPKKVPNPMPPVRHWSREAIGWMAGRPRPGIRDATAVRVAVLDTGLDRRHPSIRGAVKRYVGGTPGGGQDLMGHGTHVTGIIAGVGRGDNQVSGLCRCELLAWKVFADEPVYIEQVDTFYRLADPELYHVALTACLQQRVQVMNLSLGGVAPLSDQEAAVFGDLLKQGTTIVAAMGNNREYGSPTAYPAALPGVIAVGATDPDDVVAPFSSAGAHIALCAPGVSIWSSLPTYGGEWGFAARPGPGGKPVPGRAVMMRNTEFDAWPGTSMATPHVTAAAALLLANRGSMSGSDVRQRLMDTADKVPAMGGADWTPDYGAGRLNIGKLLSA